MNAVIEANGDLATIKLPFSELEKIGLKVGDEITFSKNENDEIVLRSKQSDRTKRILEATREIIEDRESALIELGKGSE